MEPEIEGATTIYDNFTSDFRKRFEDRPVGTSFTATIEKLKKEAGENDETYVLFYPKWGGFRDIEKGWIYHKLEKTNVDLVNEALQSGYRLTPASYIARIEKIDVGGMDSGFVDVELRNLTATGGVYDRPYRLRNADKKLGSKAKHILAFQKNRKKHIYDIELKKEAGKNYSDMEKDLRRFSRSWYAVIKIEAENMDVRCMGGLGDAPSC